MNVCVRVLLLLAALHSVASLFCYTCVVPALSPRECISFPVKCPPEQLCLSSRAVGRRGDFQVEVTELSCVVASLCGQTGHKHTLGLNFTFYNSCCNTNLCNSAPTSSAPCWSSSAITLLLGLSLVSAASWWTLVDTTSYVKD